MVLDRAVFDDLCALLGSEKLSEMLGKLGQQLSDLDPDAGLPVETARIVHRLVSQTGMLGFMELSDACSRLEESLVIEHEAKPEFTDRFRVARTRALEEISRLRSASARAA